MPKKGKMRLEKYSSRVEKNTKKTALKYRDYTLDAEPGTKEYEIENRTLTREAVQWADVRRELPREFRRAALHLLECLALTQEAVAMEIGVDKRVISRMLQQDRPTTEHVVGFCVAIQVPYYISEELLKMTGNALNCTPKHTLYKTFLADTAKITVERCNDLLEEANYEPLFHGEQWK